MTAPDIVTQLINRFREQLPDYRSNRYNETQLRRDYLDPFFEALGWDMTNRKGYSEKYREVVQEISVEVDGGAKAADYAFQSAGNIFFFLEAKKPAVNIETNPEPAFQIRRYAWSAKVAVSLLSDFEQLAVYDCRSKPSLSDPAFHERVNLYSYQDYAEKWDEIYDLFSYQAVHQGSLDRFAESVKGKRGTTDVDDHFLAEMERWREELARNIVLRNPGLTQRDINYAVQMTIDRLIFLRICEDRGIEPEYALRDATDGKDVYGDLLELFNRADKKYNSGLFHFTVEKNQPSQPDTLTPTLRIDDRVFKDILSNLYYPKSPYAFKYFTADILGQVYERFLGKVIHLTDHRARIEEKPEVRKAGGVYYTPTYIVDYIVKNTVGELLKDKDPESLKSAPLRVLDPACGSGSFLLGAYQYLLDWYLNWYVQHDPARWSRGKNPPIFETRDSWQLTMEKKKEILTGHIFGVDIDPQAVEVTKLSLLLKVVENPGQLSLVSERILPDLGRNIRCGNSLIGPDYYDGIQTGLFDDEERYRVNAFDWKAAFPQVFMDGGFDAVIGNPPYGAEISDTEITYLKNRSRIAEYQLDTYPLFIEKAKTLVKNFGFCGLIIPSAWVASKFDKQLRILLLEETKIMKVVIAPKNTFRDATVETMILIFQNCDPKSNIVFIERTDLMDTQNYSFLQADLGTEPDFSFQVYTTPEVLKIINKIKGNMHRISDYGNAVWGVKVYQKGKGKPPQKGYESEKRIFHTTNPSKKSHKPLIGGSEVTRYSLRWSGGYIDYGEWLAEPRSSDWFSGNRILIREVTAKGVIQATMTSDEFVFSNSVDGLKLHNSEINSLYILGIINSKLISFYHRNTSANAFKGTFPKLLIKDILAFPLPSYSSIVGEKIENLVQSMLDLHKQLAAARSPNEKDHLQRQIDITDHQIDTLVYELYALTPEEIAIVEST